MDKERNLGVSLVCGLLYLQGSLPLGVHRGWARVLAWLLEHVFHYRESVITVNLARSFPEKDYGELARIRRRFYLHLASIFTETIWFSACRGERGRRRLVRSHIVEFENPSELNRLYGESGQLMILQAHAGNWELIGGLANYSYQEALQLQVDAFAIAYLPLHSAFWDKVMAWIRQAAVEDLPFEGYVASERVIRFAYERRDRKYTYVFDTDQYPYWEVGTTRLPFLNQSTRVMTGATKLACKLDMSVGYLRYRYREDGKGYRMSVVPVASHASAHRPEELLKQYYQLLEEDIREQPWNYLWSHKRWK